MRGMYASRRRGVARRGGVCGRSRTRPPPPQELEDQRAEERNEDDVAREHHPARRPGLRQIVCSRRCRCSASGRWRRRSGAGESPHAADRERRCRLRQRADDCDGLRRRPSEVPRAGEAEADRRLVDSEPVRDEQDRAAQALDVEGRRRSSQPTWRCPAARRTRKVGQGRARPPQRRPCHGARVT
jgi:hypothetical protein